jgi:ubiquinone/menaquinone biosynthesis C-methylase UbiE
VTVTQVETTVDQFVRFTEPELDLDDVCLEVDAGEGAVSRAIARRVRHATVFDSSAALLDEGKRAADRDGVMNVTFARGDATALPFLNRSFTLVLSRLALASADDRAAVVAELVRVARPGAGIIIEEATLTVEEISDLVSAAGADVKRTETGEGSVFVAAAAP